MNRADKLPPGQKGNEEPVAQGQENELRLNRRVTIAVSIASLLTALLGLLSWQMSQLAAKESDRVVHTYQASRRLQLALRHADDVETGVRGFALTGVDQFLEPYETGREALARDFEQLPTLITDTPLQHRRLTTFKGEAENRLQTAASMIAERRATGKAPGVAEFLNGKLVMDAMRVTVREMDVEERRLLDEQSQRSQRRRHLTSTAIGFGSFLGVVFLTVAGIVIRRGIAVGARAECQVRELNAGLEHRVQQRTAAFEAEAVARRETEAKLRSSEESLRMLLHGISDYAIYRLDVNGCVASWNSGAARITGYTAEEILGRHISIFYPSVGEYEQHAQESLERAALTGRSEEEALRVRKDGSAFWANAVITCLYDENQKLNGYSKVMRDISARKQSDEELRKQARLLELAHDAIIVRDLQANIVFWNRGAEQMYGWSSKQALGQSVHTLLQTVFPVSLASIEETLRSEGQWEGELRHTTRAGAEIVVTSRMSLQRDERCEHVATMEINRDITDRKQAEEIRERLAAIVDYSNDAIMSNALDGTLTDWNQGAERLFGYAAADVVGKPLSALMSPELAEKERRMLSRIGRGENVDNFETTWIRKDGTSIFISVAFSPIRDGHGNIIGASKVARDITQRRQAVEILREKEHLLSESQRIAHIGSWIWDLADPEGRLVWSDEVYRMYGAEKETFVPTIDSLIQKVLPDDQSALRNWISDCATGKKPADLEYRVPMADGSIRYFSRRGELEYDAENKPVRITGTTQDISERKHGEKLLRESDERFQAMVNGIPQLAWMADADGSVFWYNQRWYEYTGTTPAEMKGWGWQNVLHPEMLAEVMEKWPHAIREGELFDMEILLRGADGTYRTFLTRGVPSKDATGRVVRWFGTNTDISERKQNEKWLALQAEELASSRKELITQKLTLQSILDSLEEGLVAANEQGRFILWNPAARRIVGLDSADMSPEEWSAHYGSYLPDMVTPFPNEQNPLARALVGEVSSAVMYLRNPALDRGVWIETNGAPLRDIHGQIRGGVIAFRDITQRKADELEIRKLNEDLEERIALRTAQLQLANKELEAFSYSVSHDLRAPLRHIAGFSRILIGEYGETMAPEARSHVQKIQNAVNRMGLLVDTLLEFAKLGRQPLKVQPNELNAIVEQAIAVLQPECEGRDVEWRVGELPILKCDRILLGQVFQNLLSNALKYSRGRSQAILEIGSIQEEGRAPVIFIRDNGVGFNMKYAAKLFEVFQRMHTESEFEGTGVGLATVNRIVQKHGGNIWAEAEVDKGATFFFTLGAGEAARPTPAVVAAIV
jgi:PAS domain S-box-containing protein